MFENCKKKFQESSGLPGTSLAGGLIKMSKRNRKDLRNLYGLPEVPEDIYDAIMRADNGKATDHEMLVLELYIEQKKKDIRERKLELGLEGRGGGMGFGKLAERACVLSERPSKLYLEDEENSND